MGKYKTSCIKKIVGSISMTCTYTLEVLISLVITKKENDSTNLIYIKQLRTI